MQKLALVLLHFVLIITMSSCQGTNQAELERVKLSIEQVNHKLVNPPDTLITVGAPYSITRNIIRDKNGNLWFATFEGILKYNGDAFTNITSEISDKRFFSLLEDRNGKFWLGSLGEGLYYYDGRSFQNFTIADGLVGNFIQELYEDSRGNIWVGTQKGISVYDGISFKNYTEADGLCSNDVNSVVEDNSGTYWIGTRGAACTFDGKSFTTIEDKGKTFQNVRKIIKDKNDNIWLGGNDGLWVYDGKDYVNYNEDFVGNIFEDGKGNILISAGSGGSYTWYVARYNVDDLAKKINNPIKLKSDEGMFFGIAEDFLGNIWTGKLDGVYRYNGNSFEYLKKENATTK